MSFHKPKQSTLFQSWGPKTKAATSNKPSTQITNNNNNDIINICADDDEDDELLAILDESLQYADHLFVKKQDGGKTTEDGNISFGSESEPQFSVTVPGFDRIAGKLWIYPTNYPVRDYQYNIVSQALFKNTMVTLPTGLGKTFIASVVMYNYYRWYPRGKIIFMAPTKPLVAQQIEACYNIMGIPQSDTAEMTGNMVPNERLKAWKEKRVFFLTPQVITNDLSRGSCPAKDVKCVVVDEAHKALGNHAYCQVVRELSKYTNSFRILAMSATPGSDIKSVQQVLTNLLISHIEIRTEESVDIKPYTHERKVDKIVVQLGEELNKVKSKYIEIMDVVIKRLTRQKVVYNRPTTSFSKFLLLKSREEFRQNPPDSLNPNQFGAIEGDFAMSISLYHGFELLQLHGLRSLYNYLDGIVNTGKGGYGRTKSELLRNADFNDIMNLLNDKFSKYDNASMSQKPSFVVGHPKMEKLLDIAVQHFEKFKDKGGTRIMIFSQYRDSVLEITAMLNQHPPVIKAMSFIGQSSVGKAAKGFTQKEQLRVMKEFREGGYNTLVSTCVGEEGLDIGDVDLIICFDAHKSPIRLVQRMGRTGRKREGRIVMLVTEGKEEQIYNQSQYSKKSIHKAIINGSKSLQFYQHNPCMIPKYMVPKSHKMYITVKSTYKGKTGKDGGQSSKPTTGTGNKTKKSVKKDSETVDITLEEYEELQNYFTVDASDIKLPICNTDVISLHKDKKEMQKLFQNNKNRLSLTEWLPWQNRLQHYHTVDHSTKTRHLVDMVQFIELQETLGTEDDNFGLEMKMFLSEDNIIKPLHTDSSIKQLCTSTGSKRPNKSRIQKRFSDKLPTIEVEESDHCDSDLPEFKPLGPDFTAKTVFKDVFKSPAFEKLSKTSVQVDSVNNGPKISCKTKKTLKSFVFQTLPEPDCDGSVTNFKLQTNSNKFSRSIEKLKDVSAQKLLANDVSIVSPIKLDADETNIDKGDDCDVSKSHKSMSDDELDVNMPVRGRCYVRTPPPLEDVSAIFDELADATQLPRVDLVELIDDWHAEQEQLDAKLNVLHMPTKIKHYLSKPKISVCSTPLSLKSNLQTSKYLLKFNLQNSEVFCSGSNSNKMHIDLKDVEKISTCDKTDVSLSDKLETKPLPVLECKSNSNNNNLDNKINMVSPFANKLISDNIFNKLQKTTDLFDIDAELFNDSLFEKDLTLPNDFQAKPELDGTQLNFTQAMSFLDKTDSSFSVQNAESHKSLVSKFNAIYEVDEESSSEFIMNSPIFQNSQLPKRLLSSPILNSQRFDPQITSYIEIKNDTTSLSIIKELDDQQLVSAKKVKNLDKSALMYDFTKENVKPSKSVNESLADIFDDEFELPQFDLGFDLDDEDDFIPPSPEAKTSENIALSKCDASVRRNLELQYSSDNYLSDQQSSGSLSRFKEGESARVDQSQDLSGMNDIIINPNTDVQQDKSIWSASSDSCPDQVNSCGLKLDNNSNNDFSAKSNQDNQIPSSPEHRNRPTIPSCISEQDNSQRRNIFIKDPDSLSIFEQIKLKNSPASQSSVLGTINKHSVKSDRFSLKCSTPLKNICMTENFTSTPKSCIKKSVDGNQSFFSLPHSSSKKPKFSNVSFQINSKTSTHLTKEYKNEKSKVEYALKDLVSKNNMAGNDIFEEDLDMDKLIAEQMLIMDNIEKNNVGLESTEMETEKTDDVKCLNLSLKSRLSLKNNNGKKGTVDEQTEDDEDSILLTRRKRTRKILSPCLDNSDFKTPTKPVGRKKNKRKKKGGCMFIEEEAELSGDGSSDDSVDSDDDHQQLSGHFINDETQYDNSTQSCLNETDVQAMYLKSVRSPVQHVRYRLQYDYKHQDVFSQVPKEDENSEYLNDSFCVDNDYEESMLSPEEESFVERKRKPKNKQKAVNIVQGKKRLLRKISQSSSEDEMRPVIPLTQISTLSLKNSQPTAKINKKTLFSSSDEEDVKQLTSDLPNQNYLQADILNKSAKSSSNENTGHDRNESTKLNSKSKLDSRATLKTKSNSIQKIGYFNNDSNPTEKSSSNQTERNTLRTTLNKGTNQSARFSDTPSSIQNVPDSVEFPNFDLELDFHDDDDDDNDDDDPDPDPDNPLLQASSKRAFTIQSSRDKTAISKSSMSEQEKLKQERLEKQKKLQESFKAKQLKSGTPTEDTLENIRGATPTGRTCTSTISNCNEDSLDSLVSKVQIQSPSCNDNKLTIIVDSKEISGAQDIISDLRIRHKMNIEVHQLKSCDYVLSTRLAVDRQVWSEFSNGSNYNKVVGRLQKMRELYDRCCLIVETDKLKPGEKMPKKQHRSKYVNQLICTVSESDIRLLFTDSQDETVTLLVTLCELEYKKGLSIKVPLKLTTVQQQILKFYLSIPKVTYVQALHFVFNFKNISQFLNSLAKVIEMNDKMSAARSVEIYNYINRKFDLQMVPSHR